jgi:hypothetical protein
MGFICDEFLKWLCVKVRKYFEWFFYIYNFFDWELICTKKNFQINFQIKIQKYIALQHNILF